MFGGIVILIILVLIVPVVVAIGAAIGAAIFGGLLHKDNVGRHDGSELLRTNT